MASNAMLRELRIKNLAVIEEAVVSFAPGLNVLTGETGAGKAGARTSVTSRQIFSDMLRTHHGHLVPDKVKARRPLCSTVSCPGQPERPRQRVVRQFWPGYWVKLRARRGTREPALPSVLRLAS